MRAIFLLGAVLLTATGWAASVQPHYYAHDAVEDAHGVIAPWYTGLNGQWDYRVRIAAETLKRYPWTTADTPAGAVPHYVFNGTWRIAPDGTISIPELKDWDNGDLGQRAAFVLAAWVEYYRYSGDAAAIGQMTMMADTLLDCCLTPETHPWPKFLISVPVKGKPYGVCDPNGHIQLDIVAETGLMLLRAYECVGETRWLDAAKHWADLLAERRSRIPGTPPWGRYANPEAVPWNDDHMTGGVAFLLAFFDELIALGYTGENDAIVAAREAGLAWLRDELLPKWTVDDTWGRNYWDWNDPVQAENVTEFVVRYLIEHQDIFPNGRNDARNILSLFLNRTSVCPGSAGDVYSGAWAYPESSSCCGRSLWYGPLELAPLWAQYGAAAASPWAMEIARRQATLAAYDVHETGVVEDNIDGGPIVAGGWFKIAHPMALKHVLDAIAMMPDYCGANRENHLVTTASTVRHIEYGKGRIAYETYDGRAETPDCLRLAFVPEEITADGIPMSPATTPDINGYMVTPLANGDCIVRIRHLRNTAIVITGNDPQTEMDDGGLTYQGSWTVDKELHCSAEAGAEANIAFTGNQIRVLGRYAPEGGKADVWLDGALQPAGLDCWCPVERTGQVLYYTNGLAEGGHTLKIAVRGEGNPRATGKTVFLGKIQYSAEKGMENPPAAEGPVEPQGMIFGYTARVDYTDAEGHAWKPATEWIVRSGSGTDSVTAAWWTARRRFSIENTPDPELYRYGVHAPEFRVNLTVAPGRTYCVRLKFAETRPGEPPARAVTIAINGTIVKTDFDIAAAAGGMNRAVDLIFDGIAPSHGVIEVRLSNTHGGEAILQALEATPEGGGKRSEPF